MIHRNLERGTHRLAIFGLLLSAPTCEGFDLAKSAGLRELVCHRRLGGSVINQVKDGLQILHLEFPANYQRTPRTPTGAQFQEENTTTK